VEYDSPHIESDAPKPFTLSWFDFPVTDNYRLKDGNRFSVVLESVDPDSKQVVFQIVWFPKDYFTVRERPITYKDFMAVLNLKSG